MVLLKLAGTFQFTLHSDAVMDTCPNDIWHRVSRLNLQVKMSFCTSWRCVGEWVQFHLFVKKSLDGSRWSTAHWPLDPKDISRRPFKWRLCDSAPVCKLCRNEYVWNLGSRKTVLCVKHISLEKAEIIGNTKLTIYESIF